MPIVRSIPISRVRSNTESTIVLTMPNRLTMTEKPEQHVEHRQDRRHVLGGVLRVGGAGVVASASPKPFAAALSAAAAPASASRNVKLFFGLGERRVERLLGHADVAEQRLGLRRVVDAADDERALLARRRL